MSDHISRDPDYNKVCPECLQNFTASRADQIYCSRKCLNSHKNRLARQKRKQVLPVDNILHKNRDILHQVISKHRDGIISKDELIFRDFNFKFHTHTLKDNENDITYFFTYEYGFAPMEGGRYKLVKHEPTL